MTTSNGFAPVSRTSISRRTPIFAEKDSDRETLVSQRSVERGVSVDQDGKSNVWAIEPKVEVSTKSSEEKTQTALVAAGGLMAFGIAAAIILTNLPDPNQY